MVMITKKDIEYAVVDKGEKLYVYNKKKYRPVTVLFSSSEAIQYAKDSVDILIVSVVTEEHKRWLIMKEVVSGGRK